MKIAVIKKCFVLIICCLCSFAASAQFYSVRTNIIGLATTNLNMEMSMTLNRNWSAHVPVQYNPFVFSENRQFRNVTVAPGVRYWLKESYSKNFIGMYTLASRYHIGGLLGHDYRYDGKGFGAGVSYGHAYPVTTSFNIEWEIGVGLLWADYDKYKCKHCGMKIGHERSLYFLPTRIALNLVYLF